jgi:sulfoacetaldehyde acetyltransferase
MPELTEAVGVACAAQQRGVATLIEVVLNRELGAPFRRDAMQDQRCLLPRYADLSIVR